MSSKNLALDVFSTPYVFVYGTLKRGGSNNYLLGDADFISETETTGKYVLYDVGIPMLTHPWVVPTSHQERHVIGELFSVDAATLGRLDNLEGHPHGYYRTQIDVGNIRAWVYFNNRDLSVEYLADVVQGCYEWKGNE